MKVALKFADKKFSADFSPKLQAFKVRKNWRKINSLSWEGEAKALEVENGYVRLLGLKRPRDQAIALSGNLMIPLPQFTEVKLFQNDSWEIIYTGEGIAASVERPGVIIMIGEI